MPTENETNGAELQNINQKKGEKKASNEILKKILGFFSNRKLITIILSIICATTTILMGLIITKTLLDIKNLDSRSAELYNIKEFDTSALAVNNSTKNETADFKKINELIEYNTSLKDRTNKYEKYLKDIQAPYENFLKYLFLPSLNIRKDQYLGTINYDIIGEKFLETNPYNDIYLIDKWSNFIKDVGTNNEYNDINNIEIGEITEQGDEFFIPIKISYTANSYRSFLLSVEKLSITSNQKSISLINEFIYNIREIIKSDNSAEITKIQEQHPEFSQDKAIGYDLYQRVRGKKETTLINDDIIRKAIKIVAQCGNESEEYCYYKFRDKYRNLPSLAYNIGIQSNGGITENLKEFLSELPQIIKIVNFTYDGVSETTDITNYVTKQYKGSVEFRIYGDGLYEDEVTEIQQILGEKCLGKDLTPEAALQQIEGKLINLGTNTAIDTYSTIRLTELQNLIGNINENFENLTNYKKVIKTFEIYRMLNEGNICNI